MNISLIGCFINLIRNYEERLRRLKDLIEELDVGEEEIKSFLLDGCSMYCGNRYMEDSFEDIDEFFEIKDIGKDIIFDLAKIDNNEFDKVKALMVDTEDKRKKLKELTEMLG